MKSNTKNTNLIWVYPPNNWVSDYKQTFVYGWSNPKAKLFVSGQSNKLQPIKIFPNGNFAQVIKSPHKKNVVKLVQIVNEKKKTIIRHVIARRQELPTKQSHFVERVFCRPPSQTFCNDMLTIIIDPGHGGKEHGTHSPNGIPEKIFNLQVAKMLHKKLRCYLTRSTDKFVSLKQRINFAKEKKCNLFISIHHNALPDNENPLKHRGVGIYYTNNFVKPIAQRLLDSIVKETKLKKYGIFKRDFAVTRPTFYTGLLIECGFLTHPIESEIITSKKIQKKIVDGIFKAIISTI